MMLKRELLIKIQLLAIIVQVLRQRFHMPTVGRLREEVIGTEDYGHGPYSN